MKRGNWTDKPCFYADATLDGRLALLAGPFRTHQEALDILPKAKAKAYDVDPCNAPWCAYGTVKMRNGHTEGRLNALLGL